MKSCAALVLRLKHACYTIVDYTMLLQGPQVLQSSFCGSVSRYGGAIIGIQVCVTSAACVPSQAKCSSFMSLVHCNSVYWTATADICHIQSCRRQGLKFGKRRSSMTRYAARGNSMTQSEDKVCTASVTVTYMITHRKCLPVDVQKATRLSFLTAILVMGLHSHNKVSSQICQRCCDRAFREEAAGGFRNP